MHPPPTSYSSTSTSSDSVVITPVFAAFSTQNPRIVPSGHQVILIKSTAGFAPPTRTFSPPDNSSSLNISPPRPQIRFWCARTAQLGPDAKKFFFPNRILPRSGSTSGSPMSPLTGMSQILHYFFSPMLSTLFTVSTFYERLVAESKRHQYRSSRSIIRNSKHFSPFVFCVTLSIVLVWPVFISWFPPTLNMCAHFSRKRSKPAPRRRNESNPRRLPVLMWRHTDRCPYTPRSCTKILSNESVKWETRHSFISTLSQVGLIARK